MWLGEHGFDGLTRQRDTDDRGQLAGGGVLPKLEQFFPPQQQVRHEFLMRASLWKVAKKTNARRGSAGNAERRCPMKG